ncbi:hypothetical protein BPS1E_1357 [Bifidobacterium pseudocatenulatum]|uniref:Uncharacterized protein n=1 Tax=Bifidobacterium pseudocatenulatum TaxID=28026 RepID=A0A267WKK6_BIFPS|nr:hypothetical protein [Bifidobacterium pseudocatenulatum]PAC73138.1 hypothetical protein BPS1E_1357 [Bifidobacterium pseudocatenulatum]
MIDDDSNELIPFEGGDGDADASTGNNNPDDTKNVTIIQDEQGIVFLGDAGTIDLWLKDEGFDSKAFIAKPYRPSPRPAKAHRQPATPWSKADVG